MKRKLLMWLAVSVISYAILCIIAFAFVGWVEAVLHGYANQVWLFVAVCLSLTWGGDALSWLYKKARRKHE